MSRFFVKWILLGVLVLLPSRPFADTGIVFIVNRQNSLSQVSLRDLNDYYLKKKRQWNDDVPVRFIDKNAASPERQIFLSKYLHQSSSDLDLYWFGQKLHTGDSIPIQVNSDSIVIQLVKSFRGGIGYISSRGPLNDKLVKVIKITDLPQD